MRCWRGGHRIFGVEGEVQHEDVNTRIAKNAKVRSVGVFINKLLDLLDADFAGGGNAGALQFGIALKVMCGSRPEPEAVTASPGIKALQNQRR